MGTRRVILRWAAIVALASGSLGLAGCGLLAPAETATDMAIDRYSAPYGTPEDLAAGQASKDLALVEPPAPSGGGRDVVSIPGEVSLVILSQSLRMEVASVREAVESIRKITAEHKGTVTAMQVSTDNEMPIYRQDGSGAYDGSPLAGFMTVRVPNASLPAFVEAASALGTVLRRSQDSQDVTQEHVDLAARLDNLRAAEKRLREFFDSAKKVSEMLEIERELARVRGEIESLDAQKKFLERQAAMATVTFELVEPKPIVRPAGENWGVAEAFTGAIRAFVNTANTLIVLLGPVAAVALFVALPAWLVARWLLRRRSARSARASESADEEA